MVISYFLHDEVKAFLIKKIKLKPMIFFDYFIFHTLHVTLLILSCIFSSYVRSIKLC
jgi:hypothetical protein